MTTLVRAFAILCIISSSLGAQTREEKVRADRLRIEQAGYWIYNDLTKGFAEAEKSNKPLMVVLRCIPCEECVKLDDEVIEQHPAIKNLLNKFVRVRQISTNGLDLGIFQFDYDQSFAIFFLSADGTIYGRYGTRSHRTEWKNDVSVEGLASAMRATLAIHENRSFYRNQLIGKLGPKPEYERPELFPMYKDKFASELDYSGQVAKSCIHCHQVGDAIKEVYRNQSGKLPNTAMFPYPNPKILGLILDPKECATVVSVTSDSAAQQAGFQPGDKILELEGQPLISIADIQWVLHNLPHEASEINFKLARASNNMDLGLKLPQDWRARDDIAWRATSWELRRWGLGGMFVEPADAATRERLMIGEGKMALRVKHVGQYAPHNIAQQAGFVANDILVSIDGHDDFQRETDLLRYAINEISPGSKTRITFFRERESQTLEMILPKSN